MGTLGNWPCTNRNIKATQCNMWYFKHSENWKYKVEQIRHVTSELNMQHIRYKLQMQILPKLSWQPLCNLPRELNVNNVQQGNWNCGVSKVFAFLLMFLDFYIFWKESMVIKVEEHWTKAQHRIFEVQKARSHYDGCFTFSMSESLILSRLWRVWRHCGCWWKTLSNQH